MVFSNSSSFLLGQKYALKYLENGCFVSMRLQSVNCFKRSLGFLYSFQWSRMGSFHVFSIVFQELSYLFNLIAKALDLEGKSGLISTLTKEIGLIDGQFLDSRNPIFGSGVFQLLCAHLFLMYNIEYSPE